MINAVGAIGPNPVTVFPDLAMLRPMPQLIATNQAVVGAMAGHGIATSQATGAQASQATAAAQATGAAKPTPAPQVMVNNEIIIENELATGNVDTMEDILNNLSLNQTLSLLELMLENQLPFDLLFQNNTQNNTDILTATNLFNNLNTLGLSTQLNLGLALLGNSIQFPCDKGTCLGTVDSVRVIGNQVMYVVSGDNTSVTLVSAV